MHSERSAWEIKRVPVFDPEKLPPAFKSQFQKLSREAREQWEHDRLIAMLDPMYLGVEVMGMDFQEMPHRSLFQQFLHFNPTGDTHLYDLSPEIKKFMILWPRGTFKTSAVVVFIVQTILNYPDVRICFMSGGKELAQRQFERIVRVFSRPTKKFKSLFPEFCEKPITDTLKDFTVAARRNLNFPEPTLCTSTSKSVKAGSHFDMICPDDLVNETNYRSVKALQSCYQDYLDITPLLDPRGFMIVTGTRYSFGDTYERIQENAKEEMKQLGRTIWKFSIRTCWARKCRDCPHYDIEHAMDLNSAYPPCRACMCRSFVDSGEKSVLFPQTRTRDGRQIGHTVEWLQAERIRVGDEFFANQYENNPMASGTQTFTPELIARQTLFELAQVPSATVAPTFFVGDLSYIGSSDRDKSVIFAVRKQRGSLFVFDCIFGKWDSEGVAVNLLTWVWKYRPHTIWLEKFLGWEAYDKVFQFVAKSRNLQNLPVQWVKMSQVDKAKKIRIGGIKGPLGQRRLWIFAGMPGYENLVNELKKWPKSGVHDDFADTLGHVCEVPSGYETEAAPAKEVPWHKKWFPPAGEAQEIHSEDGWGCGEGIVCE